MGSAVRTESTQNFAGHKTKSTAERLRTDQSLLQLTSFWRTYGSSSQHQKHVWMLLGTTLILGGSIPYYTPLRACLTYVYIYKTSEGGKFESYGHRNICAVSKRKSEATYWKLWWSQYSNKMFVKESNYCWRINVLRFDTHMCFVAVIVCAARL